jgi:hypothetical protein
VLGLSCSREGCGWGLRVGMRYEESRKEEVSGLADDEEK